MRKEVSDRVVLVLLIFAILFSIGGTVIVYESVQSFKDNVDELSYAPGSGTGLVALNVIDREAEDEIESFE
jgi:hypothetical protein